MMSTVMVRPREFRQLCPLPCTGLYQISADERVTAMFLGPEQMSIQQRPDGKCITRGLFPIGIREDFEAPLVAAMTWAEQQEELRLYRAWSGQVITDRNGGLYDNLNALFAWAGRPDARRDVYEQVRMKGSCVSPYHGIVDAIRKQTDLVVTGLLIEIADQPTPNTYVLGATVLFTKPAYVSNWRFTASRAKQLLKASIGSKETLLVKCAMDELVGLAFATNIPIIIPTEVYESMNADGLLKQGDYNKRMYMTCPYFASTAEMKLWQAEQRRQLKEAETLQKRRAKIVPKAHEVKDASTFLRLKTSEKRAILRATGLLELPRLREGARAVDALIIPLLDEEVAYEVLRRLAETRGNFIEAAEMNDFESRKPKVARQLMEAKKRGDEELAKKLCDELNSLSILRWDPTSADGVRVEWDVSRLTLFMLYGNCFTERLCCFVFSG